MEQWKTIESGPYSISNHGNVKKNGVDFPAKMNNRGQKYLYINGQLHQLARLVYGSFGDGYLYGDEFIKHIDGNKSNCAIWNLYMAYNRRSCPVESIFTCIVYPDLKSACITENYNYQTELYRMRNSPHRSNFVRVQTKKAE